MSEVVSEMKQEKRTLRVLRNSIVSGFLAIIVILLACVQAKANPNTWKAIRHFNQTIGCGFFFDENHGLIGAGVRNGTIQGRGGIPGTPCAIYKTTDGGATWTTSVVPTIII